MFWRHKQAEFWSENVRWALQEIISHWLVFSFKSFLFLVFVVTLIITTTLYIIIFQENMWPHYMKSFCLIVHCYLLYWRTCICNCCVFVYVSVNANCIIQTEGQTFKLTFRTSSTSLSKYTHSLSVFFTFIHTVWLWSIWKASVKLNCFHLHLTWR